MALPIHVIPHTLNILLLLPIRCVVIDAIKKARNVSPFVRANDQPLGRICWQKERHNTVAIIICPVLQIVNIPTIFSNEGHVLNVSISLDSETFTGIEDYKKWRAFASLLHGSAEFYGFFVLFGKNLHATFLQSCLIGRSGSHIRHVSQLITEFSL